MDKSRQFTLNSKELWALLSHFSPGVVLGIENPFKGWLVEEIEVQLKSVVHEMVEQGLGTLISERELDIDNDLFLLIQTCAKPSHSIIASFETFDEQKRFYIHLADSIIVYHHVSQDKHTLTRIPSNVELLQLLDAPLRQNSRIQGSGNHFVLAEDLLFQARKLCSENQLDEARNILMQSGLDKLIVEQLIVTLHKPVASSSVVMLRNRAELDKQATKGLSILEGKNELWILNPLENNKVKFSPANSEVIRNLFLEFLP